MTFDLILSMERIICCNCGLVFAVPSKYKGTLQETHRSFYCPNGHGQSFMRESEAEGLKRVLEQAKDREAVVRSRLNEALADQAKLQRRIARGMCPCCKRQVHQLAAHMKTKHPDYPIPAERQLKAVGRG